MLFIAKHYRYFPKHHAAAVSGHYLFNRVMKRSLTQAQVSTALRPFYFLVHPDLLAKFPKEQSVNEASLKSLKMYLSVMIEDKKVVQAPIYATFYIKPRTQRERQNKSKLKSVRIHLKQERKVRSAVLNILQICDLPTSYVDSIPESREETVHSTWRDLDVAVTEAEETELATRRKRRAFHSTDISQPLKIWLTNNVENARTKMAKSESTRLELERRQDELCTKMSLADILWDKSSGWETMHRIGTVESLRNLCEHHNTTVKDILIDKTVVFGGIGSGLSLEGHIILYSGEVRYNWLYVIRGIPEGEKLLGRIPLVERALSQSLRNIQIVRMKTHDVTLVDDYRLRLRQLITKMGDYLASKKLPVHWPDSLSHLEMCVVTESSPLMVAPEGQILVPASCPGFLLVDFLTQNMKEAEDKLSLEKSNKKEEDGLIIRCTNELGLIQLDRDDSIPAEDMIKCCKRLLLNASEVRHLTHGNHLFVTRYYSVLSDGIICIPWNWKEVMEEEDI